MDLAPYVNDLQQQLAVAAEAGGDEAREVAERLSGTLEAATRLVLLDALSSAASEITRELAPGSVDVRLRGRDLEFVVASPRPTDYADVDGAWSELAVEREITRELARPAGTGVGAQAGTAGPPDLDDVSTSRTTLRLPDQLKARVDQAAVADGLSVNAWLVRAIGEALEPKHRRTSQRESRSSDQYTGWAR